MKPEQPAGDRSNGYDALAAEHIRRRHPAIGVAMVRGWARALPPGAAILDLGCGDGWPLAKALLDDGFCVYGIDASPQMAAAFRDRLPGTPIACEPAEDSRFHDRSFDGILAYGLMFLLPEDAQRTLIHRVALALHPGGRFFFTSPAQACTWLDAVTGLESRSLGAAAYAAILSDAGLTLVGEHLDDGGNHCYDAVRR